MKIEDLKIGERFVDQEKGKVVELTSHLCLIKICKNNHICVLNRNHNYDHVSIGHFECVRRNHNE